MSIVYELIVCNGECALLVLPVRGVENPVLAAAVCDDGQAEVALELSPCLAVAELVAGASVGVVFVVAAVGLGRLPGAGKGVMAEDFLEEGLENGNGGGNNDGAAFDAACVLEWTPREHGN